jgi:hypothetical protein
MPPVSEQQLLALSVRGDGHAVDADTRYVKDLGASDNIRITILTVNIVENTMQLSYTYQESLLAALIGVQPVPIGTFKPEITTPSRPKSWPEGELEPISFEFWTSRQHCGVPVN